MEQMNEETRKALATPTGCEDANCSDCEFKAQCDAKVDFEKSLFDLQCACKSLLTNEIAMQVVKLNKLVTKMYLYVKNYKA